MVHRAGWRVVALDQGEAGAGDFERRVVCDGAKEGAGEGGLAGAEGAFQQDGVAGMGEGGEAGGETFRGGEVGEGERARRVGGRGVIYVCLRGGLCNGVFGARKIRPL